MLIVAEKALSKQNGMKVENIVTIKYRKVCETSEDFIQLFVIVPNISQLQEQYSVEDISTKKRY